MKTLMIFTGGTIGSVSRNGITDLVESEEKKSPQDFLLLKSYADRYGISANELDNIFDFVEPAEILSENASRDFFNALFNCLWEKDLTNYNGIIITHGTDTLSYTACLTALLFSHLEIPVFFISDNYPLMHPNSNGAENLSKALELINTYTLKGVYNVFKNFDGKVLVNFATRQNQSPPFVNEFYSAHNVPFLYFSDNKLYAYSDPTNPSIESMKLRKNAPLTGLKSGFQFQDGILYLKLFPSFCFDNINFKGLKAVIVEGYHSFTAPERTGGLRLETDERHTLSYGAELAKRNGVRMYFAPFKSELKLSSSAKYPATAKILTNPNIKTADDMTAIAAFCKLLIAYSLYNDEKDIDLFLDRNVSYEKIIPYN